MKVLNLPKNLKHSLLDRKGINIANIQKAYTFAKIAHKNQFRQSGDPYITHPLWIAEKLVQLEADEDTIVSGLLHDTVEDTESSFEDVEKQFGKSVRNIVEGLTKLSKIQYEGTVEERKIDNFISMILSSSDDYRVILIKFVDRLHNLLTIDSLRKDKQLRIAEETLVIYVPLASFFGAWKMMVNLEEISFKILNRKAYDLITNYFIKCDLARAKIFKNSLNIIRTELKIADIIAEVRLFKRRKYSFYKRSNDLQLNFDEIDYQTGIEILTTNKKDCYRVLEIIHSLWIPHFDKMKDYIARPKVNGYLSFHTGVFLESGLCCDVHIMTTEMRKRADLGYFYNSKDKSVLEFLDDIITMEHVTPDKKTFYEKVKNDILQKRISPLSIDGRVINLSRDGCIIDFAYKDNEIKANRLFKAKVNNEYVHLGQKLKDGDIVELFYREEESPKLEWLQWIKSSTAKKNILSYLGKLKISERLEIGKKYLEKNLKRFIGIGLDEFKKIFDNSIYKTDYKNIDSFIKKIGDGSLDIKDILQNIFTIQELMFSEFKLKYFDDSKLYRLKIKVEGNDRTSILDDLIKEISSRSINILENTAYKKSKDIFVCEFGIEVEDFDIFFDLVEFLESLESIISVNKI